MEIKLFYVHILVVLMEIIPQQMTKRRNEKDILCKCKVVAHFLLFITFQHSISASVEQSGCKKGSQW